MDTIIEKYDNSERKMAKQNLKNIKKLDLPYPIIRVMDRGYTSLPDMYYSAEHNDKYLIRLQSKDFKKQIEKMKSNDEIIIIPYQYDRVRYYRNDYPELYQKMEETKEDIALRIVIVKNDKGEEIRLATNLSKEEFNYEEIVELYKLRWITVCLKPFLSLIFLFCTNQFSVTVSFDVTGFNTSYSLLNT